MPGMFIILNGGSSAGKTTVASAFQQYCVSAHQQIFLHFGIDSFFQLFPPNITNAENAHVLKRLFSIVDESQHKLSYPVLKHTELGNKAVQARYQSIRHYLDNGFNVIGDEQFWELEWHQYLLDIFNDDEVFLVKVSASKSTVLERERQRTGARVDRLCVSSYDYAHRDMVYDYVLETSDQTPEDLACQLYQAITNEPFRAFAQLRKNK